MKMKYRVKLLDDRAGVPTQFSKIEEIEGLEAAKKRAYEMCLEELAEVGWTRKQFAEAFGEAESVYECDSGLGVIGFFYLNPGTAVVSWPQAIIVDGDAPAFDALEPEAFSSFTPPRPRDFGRDWPVVKHPLVFPEDKKGGAS